MGLLNNLSPERLGRGWYILSYVCFIIALFMILVKRLDLKFSGSESLGKKFLIKRFRKDQELARERRQQELIGIKPTGKKKQYIDLVQSILISAKLDNLTVENFTSFLIFIGILVLAVMSLIFKSVFLGLLVAVPSMAAVFAVVILFTKNSIRFNDNVVMDSLDLICPAITHSVTYAIKTNMDAFDPSIKRHYMNFIYDIESRGMLFKEAIVELNRKLGPRFDYFAELAVMFYETGDEGMNSMFMDVVDINNSIRSVNAKSDIVFRKANLNLIGSSITIIAFLFYAYVNPMTGTLMRETFGGKLVGALVIAILIGVFSRTQIAQMTLKYEDIKYD